MGRLIYNALNMSRHKFGKGGGGIIGHGIRMLMAVLILTAFVLGIAYAVKQVSSIDASDFTSFASPYLAKVGLGNTDVGQVAGELFKRVADSGIGGHDESDESGVSTTPKTESGWSSQPKVVSERIAPQGKVLFSVAVFADSHIANDKQEYIDNKGFLRDATAKAKELGVESAIHVGDITNWGVLADLREAKQILDDSKLKYYAIPGDRDLAQSVGTDNFVKVFGKDNFTFELEGQKFVVLDNAANYTLISQTTMDWFKKEVKDADFVIISQPLYTEGLVLFNYLYMGSTSEKPTDPTMLKKQEEVKAQRDELLTVIRGSKVKAVIAGDHHKSSVTVDLEKPSLEHYVVGAITGTVSEYAQSILQSQRFSVLRVYENGGYLIEDIVL